MTSASEPLTAPSEDVLQSPSASSGPFVGIRVVELATVIAVPSCGQWLSMLGADVIKLESPTGDTWRQFAMTVCSPERKKLGTSPVFDMVNRGKRSLVLDLKKGGKETILSLLEDADVFITNYTPDQLEKHSLSITELKSKFPKLVIASMTGWGSSGPLSTVPGYDAMCFFGATGMAAQMCPELQGCHLCYPLGFGDLATGLVLAIAIALGLTQRSKNGNGTAVETSLFEVGMWAMQPQINGSAPDASASNRIYTGKDGVSVAVSHEFDDDVVKKIASAVGADSSSLSAIESACSMFEGLELIDRFGKEGVKSVRCAGLWELADGIATSDLEENTAPLAEMKYAPGLPCSFAKSIPPNAEHAPSIGDCKRSSQTNSYWKPRDTGVESQGTASSTITILEYSNSNSSAVAGACALFARLGARVVRMNTPFSQRLVEATGEDTWRAHLHHQKTTTTSLDPYLKGAQILVTDVPESERPFRFPADASVVYFNPTDGSLAGFFANYMAHYLRGCSFEKPLKQPPFQIMDMIASYAVAATVATSLFHLERFGRGKGGQIATVDMTKVCLYLQMIPISAGQTLPTFVKVADPRNRPRVSGTPCCGRESQGPQRTKEDQQLMSPVPVSQVVQLTDGRWLMNISPNLPDVMPLMAVLGIKYKVLSAVITLKLPMVVFKKLSGEQDVLEVTSPIFNYINAEVIQALTSMSSHEFEEAAKAHGWGKYAYLLLDAKELQQHEQCKALGSFEPLGNGVIVKEPLRGLAL